MIALPALDSDVIGIGWATVELERAERELSTLLAPGDRFVGAPSSLVLGGRTLVGTAAADPRLAIVLLEPETEGRLAASLARHGEAWLATWVDHEDVPGEEPGPPGWSVPRPGPLGLERLRIGDPDWGPHRLLVQPATIGR